MPKMLITGANGFIGSRMTIAFCKAGYHVVALDIDSRAGSFIAPAVAAGQATYVSLNLTFGLELAIFFQRSGFHGVIHCAWDWSKDPIQSEESNLGGLIQLIKLARDFYLNKFIEIGSDAVYGGTQEYISEGDPFEVRTAGRIYPVLKAAATLMVQNLEPPPNSDFITVIPGGPVYGPGMSPGRESRWPIYYMLEAALSSEKLVLERGGDSAAGYTHVDDLCRGILLLYQAEKLNHRLYHIGPGKQWSMRDVAAIVRNLVPGADISVGPGLAAPGDCPGVPGRGPLLIHRAVAELGFCPEYMLDKGMSRLAQWMSGIK